MNMTPFAGMITFSSLCILSASCALTSGVSVPPEQPLKITASTNSPRTINMCGPSHDEEMIYGLAADGTKHYFAVGTDVGGSGITIWQSDHLTSWKNVGRVFPTQTSMPKILQQPGRGVSYDFNSVLIDENGEYHFLNTRVSGANNYRLGNTFWAPCIFYNESDQTYYLYYSCSAFGTRNSFIGCASSKALDKGWVDRGQLIHTRTGDGKRFNAIDPVVFRAKDGKVWMAYGSFFGGISMIQLDEKNPARLKYPGTHGKTVACRGYDKVYEQDGFEGKLTKSIDGEKFTAYGLEGASVVYRPETGYYYLFVSYDRLAWSYHVRVGRSKNVEGPYHDFHGSPMIYNQEKQGENNVNGLKIAGSYRWKSCNAGWGGIGHTTLFNTADGNLLFGSNSKAGGGISFVGLRKVFWSADGWPLLSPSIYAGEGFAPETTTVAKEAVTAGENSAEWDFIVFSQPHDESGRRTDESKVFTLSSDGKLGEGGAWTISRDGQSMTVKLPGGVEASGKCAYGWDQDRKQQTVIFTGLTKDGIAVWGQRATVPVFPLNK